MGFRNRLAQMPQCRSWLWAAAREDLDEWCERGPLVPAWFLWPWTGHAWPTPLWL